MVEKGYLANLAFIWDTNAETPNMDSILLVKEFLDVFLVYVPGMPPDRNIDFGSDLISGTWPISILSYCMALVELKELKEKL